MAPVVGVQRGDHDPAKPTTREIKVLVTGFGPFRDQYPVNPSFEIARGLPELIPLTSDGQTQVRIITYGTPVRVAYGDVRKLVPLLHDAYHGLVDLVLHIGMAADGNVYYLERLAHRDGYNKYRDVDGVLAPADESQTLWSDCPGTMATSLDYADCLRRWQTTIKNIQPGSAGAKADCRPSDSAGYYLCDYIYFNSLAYYGRGTGHMEAGKPSSRPVLFLHVPAQSNSEKLEQGTVVAIALIRAMAESFVRTTAETRPAAETGVS